MKGESMYHLITIKTENGDHHLRHADNAVFKTMDDLLVSVWLMDLKWTSLVVVVIPPGERK